MRKKLILFFVVCLASFSLSAFAQTPQLLKRTIIKTDTFEFGVGGTVAIAGAPNGSIRVVGGTNNEIEITAEIELQAASEKDLDALSMVTGFLTEETLARTGIVSFGTYNKLGDKKLWKKFPKNLLGLPLKIDYVVRVPRYCDLEIDGGKGDLSISGVEGAMRVDFLETNAKIEVIGGSTALTIASGKLDIVLGSHGWRGRFSTIKIAKGDLTVRLPSNMNAEIEASILLTGAIENTLTGLKPMDRKVPFTDKSIIAKAGVGGVPLKFTVGEGTLKMQRFEPPL